MFESIDRKETDKFLAFFTDDALLRFGNADAVTGKA